MKPKNNLSLPILVTFGVIIIQTTMGTPSLYAASVIVIANKNVNQSQLTKQEIQDIFLGDKTTWNTGRHIVVVTLGPGAVHDEFIELYVKKTSAGFSRYWRRLLMTGRSRIPICFETENELLDYVAKTDGAIGYISPELLNETVKKIPIQ